MNSLPVIITDGGRAASGLPIRTRDSDCVPRAIALTTGLPYASVHDELERRSAAWLASARRTKAQLHREKNLKAGVDKGGTYKQVYKPYLAELGFIWTPTMAIGTGTTVHVREGELPATGTHILSLSGHVCALIDGVVHDRFDPSRDGTRCVYGYWTLSR